MTNNIPATGTEIQCGEREFYSLYGWCLNPLLTVRELFFRLQEELARYGSQPCEWQREEARINVFLFIAAIACTVDDACGAETIDTSRFDQWPLGFSLLAKVASRLFRIRRSINSFLSECRLISFKQEWYRCLEMISSIIAASREPDSRNWIALSTQVRSMASRSLPGHVFESRMRLPEAFRSQVLSHWDVFSMIEKYCDNRTRRPVLLIGFRTAGAYFAPLAAARMQQLGWHDVETISIRPKHGLSFYERRRLSKELGNKSDVILIDDHPNTGKTLRLALNLLRPFNVRSDRIHVVVPSHPAELGWVLPPGVTVHRLFPEEFYKVRFLDSPKIRSLLSEYGGAPADSTRDEQDKTLQHLNATLTEQFGTGFHVSLKRVFNTGIPSRDSDQTRVLAKSVGWGWLGYHGYLACDRLQKHVPRLLGQRHGLLFMEWINDAELISSTSIQDDFVRSMGNYIGDRVRLLRLTDDPCASNRNYRWTARDEVILALRRLYGPLLGRLNMPALTWYMRQAQCPVPSLVDGRMRSSEWLSSGGTF